MQLRPGHPRRARRTRVWPRPARPIVHCERIHHRGVDVHDLAPVMVLWS